MGLKTDIVVDEGLLAGFGLFIVTLVAVISVANIWHDHNADASDERVERIQACATIEDPELLTLCLKK